MSEPRAEEERDGQDHSTAWLYDIARSKVTAMDGAPESLKIAMRAIADEVCGVVLDALRSAPIERRMWAMGMVEADYEATAYRTTWVEADRG